MLIYCLHHGCPEVIDDEIIDHLMKDNYLPINLNIINIIVQTYLPYDTSDGKQ